jgi:hypothetical protein
MIAHNATYIDVSIYKMRYYWVHSVTYRGVRRGMTPLDGPNNFLYKELDFARLEQNECCIHYLWILRFRRYSLPCEFILTNYYLKKKKKTSLLEVQ